MLSSLFPFSVVFSSSSPRVRNTTDIVFKYPSVGDFLQDVMILFGKLITKEKQAGFLGSVKASAGNLTWRIGELIFLSKILRKRH